MKLLNRKINNRRMKKKIALSFILILNSILTISRNINEKLTEPNHFLFKENKGQLHDQYNKSRKDILYYSSDGKINLYLKKEGVSMQLSKLNKSDSLNHTTSTQFSRVDIQWLNANKNCFIKNEGEHVKNYNKIIYNNIYNDIDLIWYQSDGKLKYDFIINPGADYKDIQINYQGADYISINKLGELVISTSLGKIIEQAPLVFQNKKTLKAKWKIKNNIISFDITGANKNMPITIDPGLRMWGTYYGGSSYEEIFKTVTDKDNNVYVSGYTSSANNIATSGSFQSSLNIGAGGSNSFLAKFNSNGVRLWSTYYGDQFDGGNAKCAVDNLGNIFLLSYISTTPILGTGTTYATAGTQNPISAGNAECYLVKFNSAGQRVWGTFFGGPNDEFPIDCAADNIGNVYITGQTNSKTLIASPSSHQINAGSASTADNDYFIAKFTSNGLRVWSTYYGGSSQEDYYDGSLSVDNVNNVYFASNTKSSDLNAIATIGSHQSLYGGVTNYNGFLVKFNPTGTRQWGTYYGGSADDIAFSCFADKVGNVYLAGKAITSSGTVIATSNGYQPSYGGGASDSYIAKFNSAGQRIWGTYYGGFGDENHTHCSIDKNCNLYLCGRTSFASTPVLTTIGSEQTNFGGVVDCFIAKLDSNSNRIWGSLYGGNVIDYPNSIVNDTIGDVYMAGYTNSTDTLKIATGGSHQSSLKGSNDGFLVKFVSTVVTSTNNPQPIDNSISTTFCGSGQAVLLAGGTTGIVNWYTVPSGGTSISTGTFYVTPTLTNTTTYYADNFDGFTYSPRTAFQVTILSLPVISVTGSTIICNFYSDGDSCQ